MGRSEIRWEAYVAFKVTIRGSRRDTIERIWKSCMDFLKSRTGLIISDSLEPDWKMIEVDDEILHG